MRVYVRNRHGRPTIHTPSSCLDLHQGRDAVPLYLFPGAGHDDEKLNALRARCAPVLDVAILNYPEWRQSCRSGDRFDDIVDRLAARVEAAVPPGRACRLAGYSLGGNVAFAIARRMRRAGRPVAFLGLIDAQQITRDMPLAALDFPRRDKLQERLHKRLRDLTPNRMLPSLSWLKAALIGGDPRLTEMTYAIQLRVNLERAWLREARRAPVGEKLDVRTVLFMAGPDPHLEQCYDGWRELCADLRTVEVDGTHATIFTPRHIDSLAGALVSACQAHDIVAA